MLSQRQRPVFMAVAALLLIWVVAFAGYRIVQNMKVTPDKVRAYTASVDFSHLSVTDRDAAIKKLAAMLDALTLEERQKLRFDRTYYKWFEQMTEDEKSAFLAATMPTGFKQMISAFQDMPTDKRQKGRQPGRQTNERPARKNGRDGRTAATGHQRCGVEPGVAG